MSEQYYTLKIAGLERQLKRFSVSDTLILPHLFFSVMLNLQRLVLRNF